MEIEIEYIKQNRQKGFQVFETSLSIEEAIEEFKKEYKPLAILRYTEIETAERREESDFIKLNIKDVVSFYCDTVLTIEEIKHDNIEKFAEENGYDCKAFFRHNIIDLIKKQVLEIKQVIVKRQAEIKDKKVAFFLVLPAKENKLFNIIKQELKMTKIPLQKMTPDYQKKIGVNFEVLVPKEMF